MKNVLSRLIAILFGLLLLSHAEAGTVKVSWQDRSTDETAFEVERRIGNNAWTLINTTAAGVVEYIDATAHDTDLNCYRIRVKAGAVYGAYSNQTCVSLVASTIPKTAANAMSQSFTVADPPASDVTPPTVSITEPAANSLVVGTTTITATAADAVGVQRVEFFVDGTLKATDSSSPYSFDWDTTNGGAHLCIGSHTHSLTARAYDSANNSTLSSPISVNMGNPSYCTPPPPPPAAGSFYVATTGSDANAGTIGAPFLTILKGMQTISAAGPGSTLYIRGGAYKGWTVSEATSINPRGTDWTTGSIQVKNYPGETVTITSKTSSHIFTILKAKYLVFDGESAATPRLIFDGQLTTSGISISGTDIVEPGIHDAEYIRMTNFEVKRARGNGVLSGYGQFREFLNCKVHDNGTSTQFDHGFYVTDNDVLIEGCEVHTNTGYGIHIYGGGVQRRVTFRKNILRNNGTGAIIGAGGEHKAYNNLIYDNAQDGIFVAYYGSGSIWNNTIAGTGTYCVFIQERATATTVENNLCSQGLRLYVSEYNPAALASQPVHTIRNNIVQSGSCNIIPTNAVTANNFCGAQYAPNYVDLALKNFHLQAGSPGINQGRVVTDVTVDYDNVARPQAATYDIGAFEQ